ncbi:MAG: amidohydrolase [Chlorobiaceae bacterium]
MKIKAVTLTLAAALVTAFSPLSAQVPEGSLMPDSSRADQITVFLARKIITMNPSHPEATAVAVRNGQILGVGSLEDLAPWLKSTSYRIDRQFSQKILMPGFIEPHMHPILGALAFGAKWIPPESWDVMGEKTPATQGAQAYITALKAALDAAPKSEPMFLTWGYSQMFHGEMSRAILDKVSSTYPIFVLHRSDHEAYFNTPMLKYLEAKGLNEAKVKGNPQVDWEKGHFWEDGFFKLAVPYLADYILAPARVDAGYAKTRDYLNYNGITTVADMADGMVDWTLELSLLTRSFGRDDSPIRVRLTPDVGTLGYSMKSEDKAFAFVSELPKKNTPHLFVNGGIKLFADGAMFSQAMQMRPPGYIDGHHGEWITPPSHFEALARRYWNAGYQIHVHTNGDGGAMMVLDVLEKLERETPRVNHRFTVEHYGYSTDEISHRIATLGALVSANPFYLYDLGDKYAEVGLGTDRAAHIAPLGGLVRRGVPVSLHSDFAMAPASPLLLAWTAITRQTQSGKVFGPQERLTLDQAMRAITIDAAYILHLEDRLGSIEAGKTADFSVLEEDPYKVGVEGLRTIKVWGTVFEGRVAKARSGIK